MQVCFLFHFFFICIYSNLIEFLSELYLIYYLIFFSFFFCVSQNPFLFIPRTVSDPEVFFPLSSSYNEEEFKLLDGELISLMERMEGGGGGESRGSGPGPKMQVTTTPPSPLLLSEKDKHTDERSTKMLRSRTFREILRPKSVRMRQSPKKSFHLTPPVALSSSANRGNPLLERLSSTETSLSSLDRTKANPVPKDRRRSMTPVDQLETPPSSESKKKKKTHRRQNSRA